MPEKVVINQDECIGCESCAEICPEAFAFDEELGKATVKDDAAPSAECVDEAIASCPAGCITKE